jgi:hypothetical protein
MTAATMAFPELQENQRRLAVTARRMQRSMRDAMATYPHLEGELRALARASVALLLRLSFESPDAAALAESCEAFRACLWARHRRAKEAAAVDCCEHLGEGLRGACREVFQLEAAVLAREPAAARLLQRRLVPACCAWGLLAAQHAALLARLAASLRAQGDRGSAVQDVRHAHDVALAAHVVGELTKSLAREISQLTGLAPRSVRATLRSWAGNRWVWYGVALALGAAALYYHYPLRLVAPPPSQVLHGATLGGAAAALGNATEVHGAMPPALLSLAPGEAIVAASAAAALGAGGPAEGARGEEAVGAPRDENAPQQPAPASWRAPSFAQPQVLLLPSILGLSVASKWLIHLMHHFARSGEMPPDLLHEWYADSVRGSTEEWR